MMKKEILVKQPINNSFGNQSTKDIMKNLIFKSNQEMVKRDESRKV